MPFAAVGAGVGAVGSIVGGGKQAGAVKQAASDQLQGTQAQIGLEQNEFNTVQANERPFLQAGQSAVGTLASDLPSLLTPFNPSSVGPAPGNFSFDPSQVANDPAYQFALQQGQQALQRSAAAKGEAYGGAAQKSAVQFAEGTAAQFENQDYNQALNSFNTNFNAYQSKYSDAFNTFETNQNSIFNKLAGVAQIGQGSQGQVNQAGQAATSGMVSATGAGANAQAAGLIGQANAQAGMFGGLSASLQTLLNNPNFASMVRGSNNTSSYNNTPNNATGDGGFA